MQGEQAALNDPPRALCGEGSRAGVFMMNGWGERTDRARIQRLKL